MKDQPLIRKSTKGDLAAIETLYPEAFPDEDLVPLVRDLLRDMSNVLSLVAEMDSQIVGHVAFTRCGIGGSEVEAALLAPLAVAPARQKRGVGTAIVRAGLRRMEDSGVHVVCVLGDPNYYGRLGFAAETSIEPPYPLPPEWRDAWQSQSVGASSTPVEGKLDVPPQWREASLWAP